MDEKLEKIAKKMVIIAKDGKVTCAQARDLAQELEVPYSDVGETANQLKIKILMLLITNSIL